VSSNTKRPPRPATRHRSPGDANRPFVTAADILERTLATKRIAKKLERFSLFLDWSAIVGESVASVCIPRKFIRGTTLLVEVKDSVWVQELSLQKTSLIRKITSECPEVVVDDINFVSGDPKNFE
jgi:predicted nucleic acid-binding Zn ribbon protein